MTVIDISRYQGAVDFNAVKGDGVSRVIAKMGGGDAGVYVDARWASNRDGIRAAGLDLGSYFFNGPGDTPTQAADFQFANIDWRPGDLVVIDVEGHGVAYSPAQAYEWATRMRTHGVPASDLMIYISRSVENGQDFSQIKSLGVELWVADYGTNTGQPGTPPRTVNWPSWALWQYTSNGSVAGVPGRVDMSQIAPEWAGSNVTPLNNNPRLRDIMRLLPQDNTSTYFLEVEGVGLYTVPDQGTADILFRYLNPPAGITRADIDAAAAFVAGPPTYKTFYRPATSAAPTDMSAVLNAITAAVTSIETHGTAVDLSPVLTQLANLTATLTKGYTFNVKPSA